MQARAFIVVAALTAIGVGGYWMLSTPPLRQASEAPGVVPSTPPASPAAVSAEKAPQPREPSQRAQWADEAGESERRGAFHERAREFFAAAPALDPAERERQARELELGIDEFEASGALSAGEALLMRSALIRETVTDPLEQSQAMGELQTHYRVAAEARAATPSPPDPAFELYRAREAEIVRQVMAMSEIPGGESRDEYLRQRLQAEREALLGDR